MSADHRYDICPKCKVKNQNYESLKKLYQEIEKQCKESYGKVSKIEYMDLLSDRNIALDNLNNENETEETFRQYIEVGMKVNGMLYISYSGECDNCKFEFNYKNEINSLEK